MDIYRTPISSPSVWIWEKIQSIPIEESGEELVPLSLYPKRILVRSQYYVQSVPDALSECFIRESAFFRLREAVAMLPSGFKFVIFDGWRSLSIQKHLYDSYYEEIKQLHNEMTETELSKLVSQYVALPSVDPRKPSPHLTGGAVDLGIVDDEGCLLYMGSNFDETSSRSATCYYENVMMQRGTLDEKGFTALQNRRLLYHCMKEAGFTNYPEEWWHYDYGNQNWAYFSNQKIAFYGMTQPWMRWRSFN